jgi:hypothetical protein
MEESLSVLMEAKECPEDELLVTLVKIQLIMDKIHHMRRDGENKSHSLLYTKAFQSQLESVKSQIPQRLQQDSMSKQSRSSLDTTSANGVNRSRSVVPYQCRARDS